MFQMKVLVINRVDLAKLIVCFALHHSFLDLNCSYALDILPNLLKDDVRKLFLFEQDEFKNDLFPRIKV